MKGRQIKRLISFLETGQVCRENISIISMVPGMLRFTQQYDQLVLQILERMYKQAEPIDQYSKDKKAVRKTLVEHAVWLSSMASAYSTDINSHATGCFFNWSYTSLFRKRDLVLIPLCTIIYDKLKEHQEHLKDYGIKKKDVALLFDLTQQFQKLFIKPRLGVMGRAVETQFLTEHIDEASVLLYEKMDKMLPCFRQYPEFCKVYMESRNQKTYADPKGILEKKIKDFYLAPQVRVSRRKKKMGVEGMEVLAEE
ncbi:MAG: hypothetical protein ABIT08_05155 [Bacteroidia bacterium]